MLGKDAEKLHYFSVFLKDAGGYLFWKREKSLLKI